MIYFLS
ncbi:hypothetical protein YPPY98_4281, partial [Yersinia pestis PY-98]